MMARQDRVDAAGPWPGRVFDGYSGVRCGADRGYFKSEGFLAAMKQGITEAALAGQLPSWLAWRPTRMDELAAGQVVEFLGARGPLQDGVAMRMTTEPGDDVEALGRAPFHPA